MTIPTSDSIVALSLLDELLRKGNQLNEDASDIRKRIESLSSRLFSNTGESGKDALPSSPKPGGKMYELETMMNSLHDTLNAVSNKLTSMDKML